MSKFIFDLQRFDVANTDDQVSTAIATAKSQGKTSQEAGYNIKVTYNNEAGDVLYFNDMHVAMQSLLGNADTRNNDSNKLKTDATAAEVELLANFEGRGFNIGYTDGSTGELYVNTRITKVNINLGGHTYTFNNPPGGAQGSGTQDEGISIAATTKSETENVVNHEGNTTVTIQNGKLDVTSSDSTDKKFKRVITNYGNLTLTNVEIDGTNMGAAVTNDATKAVVTTACGVLNINGSTSIKAADNVYALGGRYYASSGTGFMTRYATEGFTINVDTTGQSARQA